MAVDPTSDPVRLLADTVKDQQEASNPAVSAWVSANAGAGKTHVLKTRVLRLLLSGTMPDRILCLTYTKAAAAEMASRVFDDLARWATSDEAGLDGQLGKVLGRAPDAEERQAARRLFARAIETPGGLKVQTIHAFCERLLQRFPLEAGVPPGFTVLDDEMTGELRREAIDRVLGKAVADPGSPIGSALRTMIAFAAEDGFDEVLARAIAERGWLDGVSRLGLDETDPLEAVAMHYRDALGVRAGIGLAAIQAEIAASLSEAALARAAAVLSESTSKQDQQLATKLAAAKQSLDLEERVRHLEAALLTAEKAPRSDRAFITKAVRQAHPDVVDRLTSARDAVARLVMERQGVVVLEATLALLRFSGEVLQAYRNAKAQRASLDFEDLILHTSYLLQGASAAEWVLYKLDGGLDHILVDEAQDTSPVQWRIIEDLAREFFTGAGSRDSIRTLFAVGDEKQSIYSFQGAAPRMFAEAGQRFMELAKLAGLAWEPVGLRLSFRTVVPVLQAVDRVFADPALTPGLMAGAGEIRHHALRIGQAGMVEIWPTERHENVEEGDLWTLGESGASAAPAARLADRIADTIKAWLDDGEVLVSEDRPVTAGDILILVRKRNPFAGPMIAALKARKIPVAGTDRMMLAEQVAVQDLLALADFLTLPEDDLALATVLKSPLFDLTDEDLIDLAPGRKGMLWTRLLAAARTNSRYEEAARLLLRWRAEADIKPPFEFYAAVLDRYGIRARIIERLGAEAIDPLDEFLSLSIAFDDRATPSLTGFVDYVRKARRELKRDMEHGRNEVRVMTVHGAKGLEAPIVFLPDTCSGTSAGRPSALVGIEPRTRLAEPLELKAWAVKGSGLVEAIARGRGLVSNDEKEEANRLLYVAMTRARDRLYVAGFEGRKGRSAGCWYDLISNALGEQLTSADDGTGRPVQHIIAVQSAASEPQKGDREPMAASVALPSWATSPAPVEKAITIPLAPSRLAPLDVDDTGDPVDPAPLDTFVPGTAPSRSPIRMAREGSLLRGTITHSLLEHLPSLPRETWKQVAEGFVERRGPALPSPVRSEIVSQTLAVLTDPGLSALFGPGSRSEVPVVANVLPPAGRAGAPLRITGQIDRLLVGGEEVFIADYKSNASPPASPDRVAPAYLYQLAAYRLAVREIFAGKRVTAAILWTNIPAMMTIPAAVLDEYESRLWALDKVRLDALAAGT
jgi:ATP-dependent helicase/nuclease subunit A